MNGTAAIVDASVALKWYVAESDSATALKLVEHYRSELGAPTILMAEFANALWKKWRQKLISSEYADHAARELPQFFTRLVPTELLIPEAMELSRRFDHPVYDCCYLALAIRENAPLVTADRRLIATTKKVPSNVEVIPLSKGPWVG
jgi:predicted nucleic acid-binding protein